MAKSKKIDYILHERVARGAESVLYRARSSDGKNVYCVKAIRNVIGKMMASKEKQEEHQEKLEDIAYKAKVKHLANEYSVGRKLQYEVKIPIVRMYGLQKIRQFGVEVGYDLLMEFIEGDDLGNKKLREEVDLPSKMNYLYQTAQALHFMHRNGFVHLDMKPSNIMVSNDYVKLIDFGVSAPLGRPPNGLTGTNGFFSPEQILGEPVDAGTDIFALGVTFACVFGGKPLQQDREQLTEKSVRTEARFNLSKSDEPLVDEVPDAEFLPELRDLIRRCTIPKRDARIRDMRILLNSLKSIAREFDIQLTEPHEWSGQP